MPSFPESYHYLLINALIVAYPLAQSYEPRLRFMANWKAIFTAIAIGGGVFLMWEELFTALGVWGFNQRYLSGIYLGRLPLEEYGFYITTPFTFLFVYEALNYFIPRDVLGHYRLSITWFFLLISLILGISYFPRIYSAGCFFFLAGILSFQLFIRKSAWLGRFFLAYVVCLIPFAFVNSWLTGAYTAEPIVWYNDMETMGIRLRTIPLEDLFYQLAYFMLIVSLYERSKSRAISKNRAV